MVIYEMHNGIVNLAVNFPIVHKEGIGNVAEALQGFFVFADKRFLGDVAAGHYQYIQALRKKQVMQRCVTEHKTKRIDALGDRWGHAGAFLLMQQDNRALWTPQQLFSLFAHDGIFFYFFYRSSHRGEGFVVTSFSLT